MVTLESENLPVWIFIILRDYRIDEEQREVLLHRFFGLS